MKQFYNVLLVMCLTGFHALAQDFAPVGAEWTLGFKTYGLSQPLQLYDNFKTVKVTNEVMKEGKLCRVLEGEVQPHSPNGGLNGLEGAINYIYNENNAVYAWFEQEQQFQKVFDFDAQVGDSWDVLVSEDLSANLIIDTFRVHIDSTFTELLDGVSTNSYIYSLEYLAHDSTMCPPPMFDYSLDDLKVNSKLGAGYYILPIITALCVYDPYLTSEMYTTVRCYTDDEISYSNLGGLPSCDYSNLSVIEMEHDGLSIKLNTDYIEINSDNQDVYTLTLFNVNGQQVSQKNKVNRLYTSGLEHGLYVLQIRNKDINISQKIKL